MNRRKPAVRDGVEEIDTRSDEVPAMDGCFGLLECRMTRLQSLSGRRVAGVPEEATDRGRPVRGFSRCHVGRRDPDHQSHVLLGQREPTRYGRGEASGNGARRRRRKQELIRPPDRAGPGARPFAVRCRRSRCPSLHMAAGSSLSKRSPGAGDDGRTGSLANVTPGPHRDPECPAVAFIHPRAASESSRRSPSCTCATKQG